MIIRDMDSIIGGDNSRKDAIGIIEAGIKASLVENLMSGLIEEGVINAGSSRYDLGEYARVFVVGFGKASASMALFLEENLGEYIEGGVVISKRDPGCRRISVLTGSHPIVSDANVRASERLIGYLNDAGEGDIIICLISGGGSALLTKPADGVSLEDYVSVSRMLLNSGASIDEFNAVRKHLDELKGGGLLKYCGKASVLSLVISDVVGDRLDVIASGPTCPDESTFSDSVRILRDYGLWNKIPESIGRRLDDGVKGLLSENPKGGDQSFNRVVNQVIGGNRQARKAALDKAGELGYNTVDLGEEYGESRTLAAKHARMLEGVGKATCLVSGGETSVTLTGSGMGGRNQEYVLGFLEACKTDFTVCAVDTDGIDGFTDAAGAIADNSLKGHGLDAGEYLSHNNSHEFFRKTGALVYTGETGTNVNDLRVILTPKD
ncbi:MAG: DUF4147 domain-containing protein [Candidatus Altiarchaeota archaeon]